MKLLFLLVPAVLLTSCAGYRLGSSKPAVMAGVKAVAVPMFANDTQHPRVEALATSAVANAFTSDGTYRLANAERADAILVGRVTRIDYSAIRGNRLDTLRPEELNNTVTLEWVLKDANNPAKVITSGTSVGSSQFFVDPDLQLARNNALPDALGRAAEAMVSRLANGL